ncbi:MAG: [protein-PII] uridylyltransferase [Planctomycetes bacterium]|nr:[protein-PII] uridylyltransferase [Planctomycetota bacterium]
MPHDDDAATESRLHLPALGAVAQEIAATVAMPRPEAIQALRAIRAREYEALHRQLVAHINETTGHDIVLALTSLTDAIVCAVVERALRRSGAPADWTERAGLFALGGYGRGEMHPHSDLDVLMLVLEPAPEWARPLWEEIHTLLWDLRYQVGGALRTEGDLQRIVLDDFVTATALIEARPLIAGDAPVEALAAVLRRLRERRAEAFLAHKLHELAERRQAAGASLFVMEPNLKNSPGCQRDVQLLSTIAFLWCGRRSLFALEDLGGIARADLTQVLAAHDHLLEQRALLHFRHQRKQDVLQLADQVEAARLLGYSDVSRLRAVEHFMRWHYGQVRHVHQTLELAAARYQARQRRGPSLLATRRTLLPHFMLIAGKVYATDDDLWQLPQLGARLLEMCREAQRAGARLSVELIRAIRQRVALIDDAARADRRAAAAFLSILGDHGRMKPILSDMHAAGLLGAWFPEFGLVDCLMQFNAWHQYTVDEHTLIALGNLDDLAAGKAEGLPGMRRVYAQLPRKDLLALALLMHDLGKYAGHGHVARGAMMVGPVARRLGLPRADEDLVHFLVAQHVALSDASRMRDIREPSFLEAFAARIGTRERLDYLYCLTWADAKAVGEGVLTGWQEELLGELYRALAERLAGASTVPDDEPLRSALVGMGVEDVDAAAFLADLGSSYIHQAAPDEVRRHWRVHAECQRSGIGMEHELLAEGPQIELYLALPDRHALFADVAAVLSGHGFDILGVRTWITRLGIVLYTMRLTSIYPARLQEPETWRRLREDLAATAAGRLDPRPLLERRRQAIRLDRPPDSGFDDHAVKIDNRTSPRHTIVDVITRDEVGLLSRLCRAISEAGCDIGYASINTLGDVAVDVFYVTAQQAKLDAERAEQLRAALIAALGLPAPRAAPLP